MPKFRRKLAIEAVQLSWKNWGAVYDLLGGTKFQPARYVDTFSDTCGEKPPFLELTLLTLEGNEKVRHGDWIVKDADGEVYSCEPDFFLAVYEPVEED
jgi:hypothetical protein